MCVSYAYVCVCMFVCSVAQSCLTLCDPIDDPIDCSLTGSSVYGIFQAKYWNGFPFPPPGDLPDPEINPVSPELAGGFFTTSTTWQAPCIYICILWFIWIFNMCCFHDFFISCVSKIGFCILLKCKHSF